MHTSVGSLAEWHRDVCQVLQDKGEEYYPLSEGNSMNQIFMLLGAFSAGFSIASIYWNYRFHQAHQESIKRMNETWEKLGLPPRS